VAISIRSGFAGNLPGQGRSILGCDGNTGLSLAGVDEGTAGVPWKVVKPLQDFIRSDPELAKNARVYADERGLVISLMSDVAVFKAGSADIRLEAVGLLDKIAEALKQVPNMVRVEGHTCDLPTRTGRYPSNWELSTARATNVVRYLVERHGISAGRLSASGYAGGRPVVPNDGPVHRRMNRRVDIVIIRLVESKQF
jgi:chemotaxis protein MotB